MVLLAVGLVHALVHAQAPADRWPAKPIRFVLPFGAPGATADAMAGLTGPKIPESPGQPVIIDTRSGGGSVVATEHVASYVPDGYTWLLTSSSPQELAYCACLPAPMKHPECAHAPSA